MAQMKGQIPANGNEWMKRWNEMEASVDGALDVVYQVMHINCFSQNMFNLNIIVTI